MRHYTPSIIGAGDLQRKAATILREVARSERESLIVTHNNPQAVIMSIPRYEALRALEELEFIPHRKTSPSHIRKSFEQTGLYSKEFLKDLDRGLKKSSLYSKKKKKIKRRYALDSTA